MKADFTTENSLANVLRLFRIARDMSIKELAGYMKVNPSYICDVESGLKRPSIKTLMKYSEALSIPYSAICFLDEEQSRYGFTYRKLLLKVLALIDNLEDKHILSGMSVPLDSK